MSAAANMAIPIDLETMQRNLREVMTNLQLLEYGENVRVEDLIRQAQENLERNRHFVLQNSEENQAHDHVENIRNENRVLVVDINRLIIQRQPVAADERQPPEQNLANNADELVTRNEGGDVEPNLPINNDGNEAVRRMELRIRDWAERYERDWVNFRQNRPNDNENVVQNRQNNDGNVLQNRPNNDVNIRANENIAGVDLNVPRLNRPVRNEGNNRPVGDRVRGDNLLRNYIQGVGRRPGQGPNQRNAIVRREANAGEGGALRLVVNRRPVNRREGVRPGNPAAIPVNFVNMAVGPAPVIWEEYQRPAAPPGNIAGIEGAIAMLQERLDRLEDGRFYELMIAGRGEDRIRHMIRTLRQRVLRDNADNANENADRLNNGRRNAPNAAVNQEHPRRPLAPPPEPPPQPRPPPQAPPIRNVFQLSEIPLNQTNNLQKPAVKRPIDEENSGNTTGYQNRAAKRPKVDGNAPGRRSDPVPMVQNNENVVADGDNIQRTRSDIAQNSTHNASGNIAVEVPKKISENHSHRTVKSNNKNEPKISTEDLRDAGPSRGRPESYISTNLVRNNVENGTNIDRIVRAFQDNIQQEPGNIPQNEENQQITQQNENDDVIILSAHIPERIKIERDDDDDDDDDNDNAQNNRQDQANAQNGAGPHGIPQNLNGAQEEEPRLRLGENTLENPMPPPPVPVLRLNRENRVAPPRVIPERIVITAREFLRQHARLRGPEFPGTVEHPFLTVENMVAGLQNLILNEARNLGLGNRLAVQRNDNQLDQLQLELIQTFVKLKRELRQVVLYTVQLGILSHTVSFLGNSIILKYSLAGPPSSPYNGGQIEVTIKVKAYMNGMIHNDTEVCLSKRIWHPNMCPFTARILHRYPWYNMTIFKILSCVRRLLIIPDLENAATHDVVAKQFRTNEEIFRRTAQHWLSVYGPYEQLAIPEFAELLERLVEEGIPKDRALHLLSKNNWDIDRAMEEISYQRAVNFERAREATNCVQAISSD